MFWVLYLWPYTRKKKPLVPACVAVNLRDEKGSLLLCNADSTKKNTAFPQLKSQSCQLALSMGITFLPAVLSILVDSTFGQGSNSRNQSYQRSAEQVSFSCLKDHTPFLITRRSLGSFLTMSLHYWSPLIYS